MKTSISPKRTDQKMKNLFRQYTLGDNDDYLDDEVDQFSRREKIYQHRDGDILSESRTS